MATICDVDENEPGARRRIKGSTGSRGDRDAVAVGCILALQRVGS